MKIIIDGGNISNTKVLNDDGSKLDLIISKIKLSIEGGSIPTVELTCEMFRKDWEIEIVNFDLKKELGDRLVDLGTFAIPKDITESGEV